jgi:hypothetical protein
MSAVWRREFAGAYKEMYNADVSSWLIAKATGSAVERVIE